MNYIFIAFEELEEGLGTGHITRVKRLIDSISDKFFLSNNTITFITNNEVHKNDYFHVYVESIADAEKKISNIIDQKNVDIVIFDCLDYCQELYKVCKNNLIFTIGIDTSNPNSKDLDLLINPAIYNKLSHFHGPMHSIHYEDNKASRSKNKFSSKKLFICFGGIDYQKHLIKILPLLKLLPSSYEINVILSNNIDEKNLAKAKNINFFRKPKNFYNLLKNSDLAIISGGIIFQEALYLGIPTFVIPQYKHQHQIAKERKEEAASMGFSSIKPDYKKTMLKINNILNNKALRIATSLKSRSLDDGFGLKRLLNSLRIVDYLEWDSIFFNKEIYILNSRCYPESIHNKVESLIKQKKVDLIYFLCPSNDIRSINLAEKHNFKKVDNKSTYIISPTYFMPRSIKGEGAIKISSLKNIKELELLAKNTNWISRYYKDSKFPTEKLKIFYGEWVKKSITGNLDDLVFHIELDNKICGFITIKKNGINFGSIGLVAVDEKYQGHGFGLALISHAVEYMFFTLGCASVSVVTQKENISACNAYDKIGFKINRNSIWFHKWI